MTKTIIFICLIYSFSIASIAQITEREVPSDWANLIYGGSFIDRFLPMPDLGGMSTKTWGSGGVIPRDINNGIEDNKWSYWGGNGRLLTDKKYHLMVCRWAENSPKGHMEWSNSEIVHAIADNSYGPYKVIKTIGKGHNPEWYITADANYIIYCIGGYYIADNIDGPWEKKTFNFDKRDRRVIEGLSNLTFAKREDGSFIMVCRGGGVWVSRDGRTTWYQISDSTIYPDVKGRFEDPLIWRTNIQYHLIVNDWYGRIAWYMRSKDGIHWKTEPGEAYSPGIANYKNNVKEEWFKYERIKVLQDEYGRATQAYFAVIDTLKHDDLPNDNHSSKLITIPLTVGKLISVINKEAITQTTEEIKLLIKAEEGFNPNTDINIESLRFGAPEEVNFGRGAKVKSIKSNGNDAIITFWGNGNGITTNNFTAKLIGKNKQGTLLFGYSRLPGISYIEAVLSARKPSIDLSNHQLKIDIENFGQVISKRATVHIYLLKENEKTEVGHANIPPIKAYEKKTINIKSINYPMQNANQNWLIIINKDCKNATHQRLN